MAVAIILVAAGVLLAVVLVVALRWRSALRETARETTGLRDELRAQRARAEQEVVRVRRIADRQRELLGRLQQSWRAEREWNRELRGQIARRPHVDAFEPEDDVRALVLKAAIELTEADRGLLLSREDDNDDGDLDLVVAEGFDHDPRHSAVAQRFARLVLERDELVREDDPTTAGAPATPADGEIESLVAIPLYLRDRFDGVVVCANRPGGFAELGDEVLLALGDHASTALQHGRLRRELRESTRSTIRVLIETVAAADPTLHRESSRLVIYAVHLAREIGLDDRERDVLVCALLLRGLGHVVVPGEALRREGPLTADELAAIELHPRLGFTIIGQAPALRDVATAVLYHHERYDGRGYPAGLERGEIPRLARALAVLEAFGALTHPRPYRQAMGPEEACRELVACAGSQFDPEVVELFVEEVRRQPKPPSDLLSETLLEALPFDPVGVLGPLGGESTDPLTLLGDHRALVQGAGFALEQADHDGPVLVAVVQLEDLARINAEAGFVVGDHLVQLAARSVRRVAARLGGTAYRASGRRFAIVVPPGLRRAPEELRDQITGEFAGGPAVALRVVGSQPGETPDHLVVRARRTLEHA